MSVKSPGNFPAPAGTPSMIDHAQCSATVTSNEYRAAR